MPAMAEPVTVPILGDSLTAGYGLPEDQGLVPQLQAWLDTNGADAKIVNAGVSGDTTAGGLARLDWTLTPDVKALVVILGGNDMLRGIDPAVTEANLDAILSAAQSNGLPVLLVGLTATENYGPEFKSKFDAIFPHLSAKYDTFLIESFFRPLLIDPKGMAAFMQADGIHPDATGVKMIVEQLGPVVADLISTVPR
jgi:acyl-CoA thioesterase I